MFKFLIVFLFCFSLIFFSCSKSKKEYKKTTFGYDVEFLKKHVKVDVLKSGDNQQIAVVGAYQGRVMTSTSAGMGGRSYGFLKYDVISAPMNPDNVIHVFGGEDRFWLGPEGSQFSIYFEKGKEMNFKNWKTPAPIDTDAYEMISKNDSSVTYGKKFSLVNYSGYQFDIDVTRKLEIFNREKVRSNLGLETLEGTSFVGYQSVNTVKNIGKEKWQKEKGLLSIWILGMYIHSEKTTVIIPYRGDLELNTAYFGEIPEEKLTVAENAVFFKGDGTYRSKIGLLPKNVFPVLGSYDAKNNVLTIVKYSFNEEKQDYVNSLWKPYVENPYGGDVVNSYNDGPLEDGGILGPFYELETSSNVEELDVNESLEHVHQTYHFEGTYEQLNTISKKILKVDLGDITFKEATK